MGTTPSSSQKNDNSHHDDDCPRDICDRAGVFVGRYSKRVIVWCVHHLFGKKRGGDVLCWRDITISDEVGVEPKLQKANSLSVVRLLGSSFSF